MAGEDDFPDVLLEVDHTTDARRAKLGLYEAWGFPEVWVEVPDAGEADRRRPGLTIHRRVAGAFQTLDTSGAFPGWTAAEIHAALNETELSERTFAVLHRVGVALGARDGTGPDDDPMLRWHRQQGRAEGAALGMVRAILRVRGIAVSDQGLDHMAQIGVTSADVVARVALACNDSWRAFGSAADHLRSTRHRAPVRRQPGPRRRARPGRRRRVVATMMRP